MNTPEKIESFKVDHDFITPSVYISRIDGDTVTYDLRTRIPNGGDYMDNITMHSVEHMIATFIRSSEIGKNVLYFGPMGCQTGFYLLVNFESPERVLSELKKALQKTIDFEGEIFGSSRKECGNYRNLSIDKAKEECRRYLSALLEKENNGGIDFKYRTE